MKIKIILLLSVLVMLISLSGCKIWDENVVESGYYKYKIYNDNAYIFELTEEGKQQEILIIPTEFNGMKTGLGKRNAIVSCGLDIISEKLQKIYFNTSTMTNLYENEIIFSKIISDDVVEMFFPYYDYDHRVHFQHYFEVYFVSNEYNEIRPKKNVIANVSYYYNYDNSDTINCKTFFIDDLDGETIKNIPPNPLREEYEFTGWYKEKECLNKWDFENDIIPSKIYDEDGNYIYKETILYAGWERVCI